MILIYPGLDGHIDGYQSKYRTLARYMQREKLGAIVRSSNPYSALHTEDTSLQRVIEYALEHAAAICGSTTPEMMLMGFSAGAGAIAAIAYRYECISRILLVAPAENVGQEAIRTGLRNFRGQLYVFIGANDEIVGTQIGQKFLDCATLSSHKELFIIPDCDHYFSGENNGRILSQMPFYAFAEGEKGPFPVPNGGIHLY